MTEVTAAPPAAVASPQSAPAEPALRKKKSADAKSEGSRNARSAPAIPATFLDPAQLTEKPRPLQEPPLHLLLHMMARPGAVNLILYIDEAGNVARVEIDSTSLPPAVSERAAAMFAAVPFSPGRIDGTAVKSRVRVTVGTEERVKEN